MGRGKSIELAGTTFAKIKKKGAWASEVLRLLINEALLAKQGRIPF